MEETKAKRVAPGGHAEIGELLKGQSAPKLIINRSHAPLEADCCLYERERMDTWISSTGPVRRCLQWSWSPRCVVGTPSSGAIDVASQGPHQQETKSGADTRNTTRYLAVGPGCPNKHQLLGQVHAPKPYFNCWDNQQSKCSRMDSTGVNLLLGFQLTSKIVLPLIEGKPGNQNQRGQNPNIGKRSWTEGAGKICEYSRSPRLVS